MIESWNDYWKGYGGVFTRHGGKERKTYMYTRSLYYCLLLWMLECTKALMFWLFYYLFCWQYFIILLYQVKYLEILIEPFSIMIWYLFGFWRLSHRHFFVLAWLKRCSTKGGLLPPENSWGFEAQSPHINRTKSRPPTPAIGLRLLSQRSYWLTVTQLVQQLHVRSRLR